MGAFCAAMNIKPRLTPPSEDAEKYPSSTTGMKIEARYLNLSYFFMHVHFYLATDIYHTRIREARSHH